MNIEIDKQKQIEAECKGKIFRYSKNEFFSYDIKYSRQDNFTLLKRDSCKGCKYCDNILSDLRETSSEQGAIIPDDIKNGDKCRLVYTNMETDWETGYVDNWDLEFRKVENDNKN